MTEIVASGIRKAFGDLVALEDCALTVGSGEILALLGPAGAGKTLLLRLLAGFERPDMGVIQMGDEYVTLLPPQERDVGFISSGLTLYRHMSVRRNIVYPLKCRGVPRSEARMRTEEIADVLGIGHLLRKRAGRLAARDRLRVALARALACRPQALLLDDPVAVFAPDARMDICRELRDVSGHFAVTTVLATRDQSAACATADRLALLEAGAIVQTGAPRDLYAHPTDLRVAASLGLPPMNLLDFHAGLRKGRRTVKLSGASLDVPEVRESLEPCDLVLGVRPEHVSLDEDSRLRGRVLCVEFAGPSDLVTVETNHGVVRARVPAGTAIAAPGQTVGLCLASEQISLFVRASGRLVETARTSEREPSIG